MDELIVETVQRFRVQRFWVQGLGVQGSPFRVKQRIAEHHNIDKIPSFYLRYSVFQPCMKHR
jgi:hypothetical protein